MTHRIFIKGKDDPGLAVARAFGDLGQITKSSGHRKGFKDYGVIAVPEVKLTEVNVSKSVFVFFASVCIWDCTFEGDKQWGGGDSERVALFLPGASGPSFVLAHTAIISRLCWYNSASAGCPRHGPAWHGFSYLIRLDSQLGTLASNACSAELTSQFHW